MKALHFALYGGIGFYRKSNKDAFNIALYKGGGSAERDLAAFNIAQICLYIRGAIEKNHNRAH